MLMKFVLSKEMKITLTNDQQEHLCTKENIKIIASKVGVLTFDIYENEALIGFAQLYELKKTCFFLWNYAIDINYQNKHLGTKALKELIIFLKNNYDLKEMTTTYIFGNDIAKHVYEKVGFVETDVVDEDGVHEVNMKYVVE